MIQHNIHETQTHTKGMSGIPTMISTATLYIHLISFSIFSQTVFADTLYTHMSVDFF